MPFARFFLEFILKVDIDQFYGIEIDEFPAQITQVALWLTDHQMNMIASYEFGEYYVRLPLKKAANIVNGNALSLDWESLISKTELSFILGNPPFVGTAYMTVEQKQDLKPLLKKLNNNSGMLDFVVGWFIKASEFILGTNIKVGFVSTNSIVQGVQAITLWKYIFEVCKNSIFFAHQTFQWQSEARGKAAVFCVIVGFENGKDETIDKKLYSYTEVKGQPSLKSVKNINQYLVDSTSTFIETRSRPLHQYSSMIVGSSPIDFGAYTFTQSEMEDFIKEEPLAEKYFRRYVGGNELINGKERKILYLKKCPPEELRRMKKVMELVTLVQEKRTESKRKNTREYAQYPYLLAEDRVQDSDLLVIPKVSSGNRDIIPIGYYEYPTVCSDKTFQIPNASFFLFGILNSSMHMAWMKVVGGKLKGDYSYSNTLVYNNFIFPETTDKQVKDIEKEANSILNIRSNYIMDNSTLSDLYDPLTMPSDLRKAHGKLNSAVDKAYKFKKLIRTDEARVEFMFELYRNHISEQKS